MGDNPFAVVYEGVQLGEGHDLQPPCILGKAPRGHTEGELQLIIGPGAVIRPFTTIYAGNVIGANFQTGQGASIREGNVIGDDCSIGTNSVLELNSKLGNHVRVHSNCFLECVTIEDHVFIGPGVVFTDDPHPPCPRWMDCTHGATVGYYTSIGGNVTVLPGVIIGHHVLIGAGAVVTKNIPNFAVVYGNPAVVKGDTRRLRCKQGWFSRAYDWLSHCED